MQESAIGMGKFRRLREPKPVYQQLAELIQQKIAAGELLPGERLPTEVELASMLGVGRPSLREALRIVQALGVVSVKRGRGIHIVDAKAEEIVQRLEPAPILPSMGLRELFEVRKTLECQAAAWGAERGSEQSLSELGAIVRNMVQLVESAGAATPESLLDKLAPLNRAFHHQLTLCSGNKALIGLVEQIMRMLEETMKYRLVTPGRPIHSAYDHRRIYQEIAAHRPRAAALAMYAHLDHAQHGALRDQEEDTIGSTYVWCLSAPRKPESGNTESATLPAESLRGGAETRDELQHGINEVV